jgi:hypothetical protein
MFTSNTSDENKIITNPIQESPGRLAVYAINRCEDQVIGFEFVSKNYQNNPQCCGSAIVNLCIPVELITPIQLDRAEFWATDDPYYKEWILKYEIEPYIEVQRDFNNNVTGILVRFSQTDTCCYPINMAYRLYAFALDGSKYLLSSGLLFFR